MGDRLTQLQDAVDQVCVEFSFSGDHANFIIS